MTSALVEVRFEPAGVVARVHPGLTILEAAESVGVDIDTSCLGGMCGTDPVRVHAGGDGLDEPLDPERGTLERMGLLGEYRLSCSARVMSGSITVEVLEF